MAVSVCAAHPWWVLGGLLLLSLLAATQIPRVEVQISAESLLVLDDPQRDYFDSVSRRFGDEKMVLLVLEGEALLDPARLDALRAVLGELQGLPFVDRVESLFSVPHLKSVDGYLDKAPYLERSPASPGEAVALLESARKDPFVRHLLLSEDGRVMAAAPILKPGRQGGDDPTVTAAIDRLIEPLHGHYDTAFAIGYPYVRSAISGQIRQEQGDLFPLAVGALLLTLFLLLRQLVDVLAPLLTALISIAWMLGLMGLSGIPLNMVTSIVPILLIVVGSTEDIHKSVATS